VNSSNVQRVPETASSSSVPAGPMHGASLARNALHLVTGQVLTMVLGVLFSAALGRTLGAGDFGLYFVISSFAAFALVVVDWGQQFFGIREVARTPQRGGELLGTGLVLRTIWTALVCVPTGLSAWALGYDRRTILFAVAFVALNLPLFLAQNFGVVFRGRDRMGLDATVSVTNRAAGLVLALGALGLGLGLGGVVVAQGLAGMVALAVALRLYRRVDTAPLHYSTATAREILTGGTAIVTMTLTSNVQPYIDAVLLSRLVPKDAVGWYAAAKSIMGTLLAPSLILGAAAFPRLSRTAADPAAFGRELIVARRPMIWMAGLAGVGTWLFADVAIHVVYGQRAFGPAGIILSVFGIGLFLTFIDVLLGTALTAIGRATAFATVKVVAVVLGTALELWLIPHFQARTGNGGIGVVVSLVLCEALIFTGLLLLMPRGTARLGILADTARAAGAALGTSLLLRLLPPHSPWLGIPLCVLVYSAVTAALGLLRRSDLLTLTRMLGRRSGRSSQTSAVETGPPPLP
jgi:O-antigen/teichoic acid export membrane protein